MGWDVEAEGESLFYFNSAVSLAAHTEATKTWSAVQNLQSDMTTWDFVSSFIHERFSSYISFPLSFIDAQSCLEKQIFAVIFLFDVLPFLVD